MNNQPNLIQTIDRQSPGLFTAIDRQFAGFLGNLSGDNDPAFILGARLVSSWTGRGNVCLQIPSVAGKNLYKIIGESGNEDEIILFKDSEWINILKKNVCVGSPGEYKPLILDGKDRLYLHKYWHYEQMLAGNIRKRLTDNNADINKRKLHDSIDRLFPDSKKDEEQITASAAALLKKFCVISGGPGTGKTTTILKILVMILEQCNTPLRIVLTAPTGKAAAKLNQSVKNSVGSLNCADMIKENLPKESFTIHRLLNTVKSKSILQEEKYEQLPYDVVIVDESSMVDLGLMYRLFEATPPEARIILLGDKDQLSSVEAGAVFGDICGTGKEHRFSEEYDLLLKNILNKENIKNKDTEKQQKYYIINDSIIMLNRSYRFDHASGIKKLGEAINSGNADAAMEILKDDKFPDITFTDPESAALDAFLKDRIIAGYSGYINEKNPEDKLRKLPDFTILCAVRNGPFGVERINLKAEDILKKNKLISVSNEWYENRPVMITQNDYNLRLFNGDIGLILKDQPEENIRFFAESAGILKKYLPQKLPSHETVFAMTVHKSQGSEFYNVLLVLPDFISPALCRELLYTAVTRAREKVEIYGAENIIRHMINTPTQRTSGLRDALWGEDV